MSKLSLLPRGFKSAANRRALLLRTELGVASHEALSGFELAKHLNIKVYTPQEIFPENTDLTALIGTKAKNNGWSALTMQNASQDRIIIHNDLHSKPRQESDIMHELAHILCEHSHPEQRTGINLPFFMREYNPQQEEEAIFLGGALQITREGLLWALKNKMSESEMANYYNASINMVRFRINSTGVKRQMSFWKS